MKKIYLLLLCMATVAYAQAQNNELPQLSARTKGFIEKIKAAENKQQLLEGYAYRKLADGRYYASALIKVKNAAQAERNLHGLNAKIGTKAGAVWTVQVPVSNLLQFAQTKGIQYIEIDQFASPQLHIARVKTKVDSVHGGYGLPMPYTGKGVIMGVMDFGFDYLHPAFYDTGGHQYRIAKVWELAATGTPPAPYTYGNEITDTTLIKANGTDNPLQNHGTSVAALAGGSGVGGDATNSQYRGVAFESDFVFVGVRRDTLGQQWMTGTFTDFIDGINYIFTQATNAGKPAVVNISWGSQSGAHDGSSLFNQACNNLSGSGKIIVMSAGNEGGDRIHFNKTFTPTDTVASTFVTFSDTTYMRTWIDAWGEAGKTFCASVSLYDNGVTANTTGFFCADGNTHQLYLVSKNGLDTCYIEMNTSAAEINNGKPHIFLNVYNKSSDSLVVSFKANDGTVHAWNESYFYGYVKRYDSHFESLNMPGMTNGNITSTVSEMGSADSVLLIGAYTSNASWTNINGTPYAVGAFNNRIAPFSSRGPYIDGRIKPDITAPGLVVATASSSFDTTYAPTGSSAAYVMTSYTDATSGRTFYYSQFSGTSASSPMAAGIVALLLQAKPDLSPSQIKELLFETAITDANTGNIPTAGNNTWGHGKINAYDALKKLIVETGVYDYKGKKLDAVLYPTPSNGVFQLDYSGKKHETLSLSIVDMKGSTVSSELWTVNEGYNQRALQLSHLPKGVYFLKLASTSGSVTIKTVFQ